MVLWATGYPAVPQDNGKLSTAPSAGKLLAGFANPSQSCNPHRPQMIHREQPWRVERYPQFTAVVECGAGSATYPRYPRGMTDRLNLHLISDATGETLNAIARATIVQFEGANVTMHRWSLIRSRLKLQSVVDGIAAEPGPVLSTLVDKSLRVELEAACQRLGVKVVHVLDPVLNLLQEAMGAPAGARPGRQYVLDDAYFKRIDAIHYVLSHDDGQAQIGIADADVVLVGVSRSSKTPTSFYLANRGIKAANVPLVPELGEPTSLESVHCPVIGLTLDTAALIEIRRHRLQLIGTGTGSATALARQNRTEYVEPEAVRAELLWARRLCNRHGWPVIDVTRRSIEETAAAVLQLMEAWHERRRKAAAQPAVS
jgi:regulator of PEP synthase PpsR (kinase-PPPase family)